MHFSGVCSDVSSPELIQLARRYIVLCLLATCVVVTSGCRSSKGRVADDRGQLTQNSDKAGDAKKDDKPLTSQEKLFLAIEKEFVARGWEIATISERFHTVATGYEPVSARMRKRRIGSILFLPKGAALKVIVEFQRDVGPEGSPDWQVMEAKGKIKQIASEEELEIARSIEKRFHNMR